MDAAAEGRSVETDVGINVRDRYDGAWAEEAAEAPPEGSVGDVNQPCSSHSTGTSTGMIFDCLSFPKIGFFHIVILIFRSQFAWCSWSPTIRCSLQRF